MLNRNDRRALRKNRAAVSWLSVLSLMLCLVIISFYRDKSELHQTIESDISQMEEYQKELVRKSKIIDSLSNQLTLVKIKQDTIKPIAKQSIKPKESKKDTIGFVKLNSDSSNKILKDSLK